ncbi:MAG: type II/IV secretion system ATPase subunit [Candidatus Aenigmarchaeota archaeon]|nr:type II/IV secretion system ATPase subunit [Candidatus Aenigmarchaeota archaeon]
MVKLKGFLYRKFKSILEKEKEEKELDLGFRVSKPSFIVELPEVENLRELDVIYPLIEPFAYAHIHWDKGSNSVVYEVIEPELTKKERGYLEEISSALVEMIDVGPEKIEEKGMTLIDYVRKLTDQIIEEFGIKLKPMEYLKIMYYIYRNFVGLNELEPLMWDPNIEDISCDGVGVPIFIVHRKYGSLRTNIVFESKERLREFIVKLAQRCGRYVSYAEPILDATLPDGSRVAATLASDVATRGPTFTIRKFGENPFSPIDQIVLGTANSEMMAYLWFLIEHRTSILIVGGTATGKTSFLNSLAMFIRPEAKIVSIEDTREIKLPHEHWIPTLARRGFGIPLPTGERYGEITLFDLLKESFRQNPDYVIVGETRGREAYVMFQGMSSGHASISTFHAGSLQTAVKRLTSPPIQLPYQLIESLQVVITMVHAKERGESARRVKEVDEIESVESNSGDVIYRKIFEWDPSTDSFKKMEESIVLKRIAEAIGATYEKVLEEIEKRRKFLEWMVGKGIKDFREVSHWINLYYKTKGKVIEEIGLTIEKEFRKKRGIRSAILEVLGALLKK